jgi:hypothetical protein
MQKILAPREVITVDAACIVAMTNTINFQLKNPNQLRRGVFGVSRSFPSSPCFMSPYCLFMFTNSILLALRCVISISCRVATSLQHLSQDQVLSSFRVYPSIDFHSGLPGMMKPNTCWIHTHHWVYMTNFILVFSSSRSVAAPSLRDNPKFFIQIVMFFFLAYVMIVSSIILTDF